MSFELGLTYEFYHYQAEKINKIMNKDIEEFEKQYPVLAKEFKEIQAGMYQTFASKMLSYGLSNIGVGSTNVETDDEKKLSLNGIWYRVNDKIQRLKQLIILNQANSLNETSDDAFLDLSVYGIIARIVSRGKWKK